MASNKPKSPSIGVRDDQSTDSVFDFLYYDAARIASFLSQFDSSGHLTEVTQGERAHRNKQTSTTLETSGTVAVVSGTATRETDIGAEYGKDSQRVYDPTWANARTFLDYLSERSLISRDMTTAGIGQFVITTGSLSISDLQLIEKIWGLPTVQKAMEAGNPQPKNNAERRRMENDVNSPQHALKLFQDLIGVLPHTTQATLTGNVETWCSLSQSAMSVSSSDIILKHGIQIPGEWNILGVLDARPDEPAAEAPTPDLGDPEEMAAKLMSIIAPMARLFLGRPPRSYGVTPLLIFREISG
ncbi:hypothetical protein NP945_17350 [Mesorhizobium sp. LMG17149]|uniref:hypothetical protein n=1 Tax=Mesorhizobium sp. LMG17149 TaxID=2968497 RepID=UPI0021182C9E|nr:hypothetical protein [Mesorhizobium sp. LMG17149]MCQ8873602.1 hypothetical protein [Mesorhizobium sp. LMG17149]